MAKKKQADFQKTKLRIGKQLPKGRNVTDTSFKTRKIITRDQLKAALGEVSLKDLLNYLGHNNAATKRENLYKLKKYILENRDTLTLFFPDILRKVGGILLEDDASVRAVAMNVLKTCLSLLSDVQIGCFVTRLTSYLNCMMTHHSKPIRRDSLKVLDSILALCPCLINHSTKILTGLLGLISTVVHHKETSDNPSQRGRKRKLDEIISSDMTAQAWRLEVLTRIKMFLRYIVKVENGNVTDNEDEHEVYWDATKPLYLPLFLRGGLTPMPLESTNSSPNSKSTDSKEFQDFVYDVVLLLSDVIRSEIPVTPTKPPGPVKQPNNGKPPGPVEQPKDGMTPGPLEQPKDGMTPGPVEQPEDGKPPGPVEQPKDGKPPGPVEQHNDGKPPGPVEPEISEKLVDPAVIRHLNVVVQILCCLGEWMRNNPNLKVVKDVEFRTLIKNLICRQLLQHFPYSQRETFTEISKERKAEAERVELNLGICYLYCLYVLDTDSISYRVEKALLDWLDQVFRVCSAINYDSVTVMLKISKIFVSSTTVNETYKDAILLGLYAILEIHRLSPCSRPINSFFMDVSLNHEYKDLLESEGMKVWFNGIMNEVIMLEPGVNRKFLKYIRKICARQYPYFMGLLNHTSPDDIVDLFKIHNEEFQLTIAHVVCSLAEPWNVFPGLADILCNPSFNLKTAVKVVHILNSRFVGGVPALEKLHFMKLLLNVACDFPALLDPSKSIEKSSDELRTVLQGCHHELHPSSKLEHLEIAKVCCAYLPPIIEIHPFSESVILFLQDALLKQSKFPIHCAIALLKIRKMSQDFRKNQTVVEFYGELLFSSLMYLSVLLNDNNNEGLESYALPELQKSLQLTPVDAPPIISIINNNIYNFGENELYHTLRVTTYLIHMKIFTPEERCHFYPVVEKIYSTCQRSKLLHPMWTDICNFLFQA